MTPRRIQRQRTKGWRMPAGAIYVGRPTRWGNSFIAEGPMTLTDSIDLYRNLAIGVWSPKILTDRGWPEDYCAALHDGHKAWSQRMGDHPLHMIRATLAGHDLACWCALDQPCHADVLLDLANQEIR